MSMNDISNNVMQHEEKNTIDTENRREDKKAFGRMILFTILGCIIGFFAGMIAVATQTGVSSFIDILKEGIRMVAPFGNIVFGTITWIGAGIFMSQGRKIYAGWDGEDEYTIDLAEMKLNYGICLTSVNMIIGFFFFGLGAYAIEYTRLNQKNVFGNLVIVFVGFLYSMMVTLFFQKNLVNLLKKINPEKKGSVYDTSFQKKWMESCDESEKLQIYQSGYAAMRTAVSTCIGLWVLCIIGMLTWDFGMMPMVMVVVIWLVLTVRYSIESIRLSKRS